MMPVGESLGIRQIPCSAVRIITINQIARSDLTVDILLVLGGAAASVAIGLAHDRVLLEIERVN